MADVTAVFHLSDDDRPEVEFLSKGRVIVWVDRVKMEPTMMGSVTSIRRLYDAIGAFLDTVEPAA
jgi:hypothetical protein